MSFRFGPLFWGATGEGELMFDIFNAVPRAGKFRYPVRWIGLFSITVNLLALAPALHSIQIYDRVLSSQSLNTLIYLSLIVLVCCVILSFAEALRQIVGQRLGNIYAAQTSEALLRALASGEHDRGSQAGLLRDLATVRGFLASKSSMVIFDAPFALLFLAAMYLLHPWLGVVTTFGAALLVAVSFSNKKATAAARQAASKSQSEAMTFAQVALQRAEDVRAMGLLGNVSERWGRLQASSINDGDSSGFDQSIHHSLGRFVRQALQVIILSFGAYLVIDGSMTGGMIIAASIISGKALQPIEQIIGAWDGIVQASESQQRIADALDAVDNASERVALPEPRGVIKLEKVAYANPSSEDAPAILSEISETFKPGQVTVIVGPSGSGKSTLARLIVGAQSASSGSVRLDGFELKEWDEERRGKLIGYVPQDISLFPGTITENIARLDMEPDSDAVIDAAQKAGVHELISRFPDGYNTKLGPGFHDISGGQRQRIALARAFYGNPRVLVLDEPNSHLDTQGEELLMKALAGAREANITTIVISQRRSILRVADRVLVMREGRFETAAAAGAHSRSGINASSQSRAGTANVSAVRKEEVAADHADNLPIHDRELASSVSSDSGSTESLSLSERLRQMRGAVGKSGDLGGGAVSLTDSLKKETEPSNGGLNETARGVLQ